MAKLETFQQGNPARLTSTDTVKSQLHHFLCNFNIQLEYRSLVEFTCSLSEPTDKLDRLGHPSPPFTMPLPILYMLCIITIYTSFVKLREILISILTDKQGSEVLNLAEDPVLLANCAYNKCEECFNCVQSSHHE